jgi:hypothetical protein
MGKESRGVLEARSELFLSAAAAKPAAKGFLIKSRRDVIAAFVSFTVLSLMPQKNQTISRKDAKALRPAKRKGFAFFASFSALVPIHCIGKKRFCSSKTP